MRVAFIGTRGVPAAYSGFETFVEQLGSGLVERGHEVVVYCRRHHAVGDESTYRGMKLVRVPGVATKHLDTISHTFLSTIHAMTRNYDVAVICISGNSPFALPLRGAGAKVVLNVDGSDWRRKKWGSLARAYIRASEWIATKTPNVTVTDSHVMKQYYLERFGVETECIAYGSDLEPPRRTGMVERLGLRPGRYVLLVGRLVPENCAHHLAEAYEQLRPDLDCVIVGDAPYSDDYISHLKRSAPHVRFPGYVFGDGYRELMHNAYAFVLCSEVGGTHPVLVEAMSAGNCVIVNNTPANLEVIDNVGLSYDGAEGAQGLARVLRWAIDHESEVSDLGQRAAARARLYYSWDAVTKRYEQLFFRLMGSEWPPKPVSGLAGPAE